MASQANHRADIVVYDELTSTSDFLKENSALWRRNFYAVCARLQTGGRGRLGRKWLMQPGRDLAFTMVYHFAGPVRDAAGLTPFIGSSLRQMLARFLAVPVLHDVTGDGGQARRRAQPGPGLPLPSPGQGMARHLMLKWPNDILCDGKKLCGILCEHVGAGENNAWQTILIGVGININSTASANDPGATSLKELAGCEFALEDIRQDVIQSLANDLKTLQFPYSAQFCQDWYKNCAHPHAQIAWAGDGGLQSEGFVSGIDDHGRLLVQDAGQRIHAVSQDVTWLSGR